MRSGVAGAPPAARCAASSICAWTCCAILIDAVGADELTAIAQQVQAQIEDAAQRAAGGAPATPDLILQDVYA